MQWISHRLHFENRLTLKGPYQIDAGNFIGSDRNNKFALKLLVSDINLLDNISTWIVGILSDTVHLLNANVIPLEDNLSLESPIIKRFNKKMLLVNNECHSRVKVLLTL